jgi:KilA-N domain
MNPAITRAQPAPLDIIGTQVRADACGRYSLNDLHREAIASGKVNGTTKTPSAFLRSAPARELVAELRREVDMQKLQNGPIRTERGGRIAGHAGGGGTFVCRELVYAYAIQHQQLAQLALALQGGKSEASLCGKVLGKWGKRRRTLVERIEALERVLQLTLDGIEPATASMRLQ